MKNTVIITGASSGIGKATALYLAQVGCRVYAGVRKDSDKNQLLKESSGDLTPLVLDVTDNSSIDQAFDLVRKNYEKSAICLVNNAGLSLNGPLELLPIQDIETLVNVNVLGLLAVTRKFLPLIRETRGRVVKNIPGIEAHEVARVISRALLEDRPKIRYLVGPGARKMKVLSMFPVKSRDKMLYKTIYR